MVVIIVVVVVVVVVIVVIVRRPAAAGSEGQLLEHPRVLAGLDGFYVYIHT